MAADRRVVITGMGVISPIGNSIDTFWDAAVNGRSGVGRITRFDASAMKTQIAAEVKDFSVEGIIDPKELRRIDRFVQYALCSADQAVRAGGLEFDREDPFRVGVLYGSGIGGIGVLEDQVETFVAKGPGRISPFYITGMIVDIVAGHISMKYGLRGPNFVTVSACASGAHALGTAFHTIVRGDADVMIAGGTEGAVTPTSIAGFINNQALSRRNDEPERASRPFDVDRDGFVMGEGSATLILEEYEHAKRRGAEILAEFTGVGFTADGYHITQPHPDGLGSAKAMEVALKWSGRNPEDVAYINTHGTSTPAGDVAEVRAIKRCLGDAANMVAISSTKSMTGHLLGAAGALEAVASVLTIRNSVIPPTINLDNQDPEIDLFCTPNVAVERRVDFVLSNSFGFGGHNATIGIGKLA